MIMLTIFFYSMGIYLTVSFLWYLLDTKWKGFLKFILPALLSLYVPLIIRGTLGSVLDWVFWCLGMVACPFILFYRSKKVNNTETLWERAKREMK